MVSSFILYASSVLECCPNVNFIPFLQSNTSSLEAHFAKIRASCAFTGTTAKEYEEASTCVTLSKLATPNLNKTNYSENEAELSDDSILVSRKNDLVLFQKEQICKYKSGFKAELRKCYFELDADHPFNEVLCVDLSVTLLVISSSYLNDVYFVHIHTAHFFF